MSYFKKIKNQKGFSLIEMVIATALFTVVILITVGIFQSVLEGQRSAVAAQLNQETMRYVFEMMSKEIRLADNYDTENCGGYGFPALPAANRVFNESGGALYFVNKNEECVKYSLVISGGDEQIYIERDGVSLAATANDAQISALTFFISDNPPTGVRTLFPRITIRIEINPGQGKEYHNQPLVMQTTVSSRRYQ